MILVMYHEMKMKMILNDDPDLSVCTSPDRPFRNNDAPGQPGLLLGFSLN